MQKLVRLLLTIACINFVPLFGEIIEVKNFKEINTYVTPGTLVVLDIDDTLLIPVQTLGTDVWYRYQLDKHKKEGLSPSEALEKTLAEWEGIRHLTKIKIVEEGTDQVIKNLQAQGRPVMGLSTQGLALATRTVQQLNSLNIDLSLTPPMKDDLYFINGSHGVLYRNGIMFTSGTHKGKALEYLLNKACYRPQQVVFINDKASHLKELAESVESLGMKFIGLRYAYCDERIAAFRPEIGELQFEAMSKILSDEEAARLLEQVAPLQGAL